MAKSALVRRPSADVPRELDARGVESFVEGHRGAFCLGSDADDIRVSQERAPTTVMDDSCGRADFGVGERRDVLLQKVHEPSFTLE